MTAPGGALTCSRCGAGFTPSETLLARFPGWQPRECPACYRAARGEGGGSSVAGRASGAGRQREMLRDGPLTLAQVLARYDAGPDTGVFTDGSANPNPGPGGWGAVYVAGGSVIAQDHGHEPHTTNNRMELQALLAGIELVPEGTAAVVHSDSNLVVRTVTEWAAGWEARGWRRKTGAVENLDLVRPAFERLRARPELEVRWIKAHAGNRWNEYADSLATAYARDEL
jgi:ribonuclease HI